MKPEDAIALLEHGALLVLIYLKLQKMEKHLYKILAWIEVNQKWRPEWDRPMARHSHNDPDEILPRDI